jgi:hypothetical protein
VDFLGALLWMGITSVSIQMPYWWLASQWAILRYIAAADHTVRRLILHKAAEDLDTHHKKVLSDDWGVGFALQWLISRLHYKGIAHGAIAMKELQKRKIAQYVQKKKNGPFKCPDFFAFDSQNRIHLIECKGNQRGPVETIRQFQRGREQKQNILFQNENLVAQRLLTGISIAGYDSNWTSTLMVADPDPELKSSYYRIDAVSADPLIRSFKKVAVIQGLVAAGVWSIAKSRFPEETSAGDVPSVGEERISTFEALKKRWFGQIYEMPFPIPLKLEDGGIITGCRMRLGIAEGFADELRKSPGTETEEIIQERDLDLKLTHAEQDSGEEEIEPKASDKQPVRRYASIQHGDALLADLEMLEA